MTAEERKVVLDAIDAAEDEARRKAEALALPADTEAVIYRLAAQIRTAIYALGREDPNTGL